MRQCETFAYMVPMAVSLTTLGVIKKGKGGKEVSHSFLSLLCSFLSYFNSSPLQ